MHVNCRSGLTELHRTDPAIRTELTEPMSPERNGSELIELLLTELEMCFGRELELKKNFYRNLRLRLHADPGNGICGQHMLLPN